MRSDLEEGCWRLGSMRWRREEEDGAVAVAVVVVVGCSDLRDSSSSSRSSILSWIFVGFLLNICDPQNSLLSRVGLVGFVDTNQWLKYNVLKTG